MKITIDGMEQIASASLMVLAKSESWLEFKADVWDIKIKVIFIDDENLKSEFVLSGESDHATLKIMNWNSSLPTGIDVPSLLGKTNGREVYFILSGYALGNLKKVDFSFFWGSEK